MLFWNISATRNEAPRKKAHFPKFTPPFSLQHLARQLNDSESEAERFSSRKALLRIPSHASSGTRAPGIIPHARCDGNSGASYASKGARARGRMLWARAMVMP